MSSKHTPGLWVAVRNTAYWEINAVVDGYYKCIGDVCATDPSRPDDGKQEANARLIAAAPELYAIVRSEYDAYGGFKTLQIGYSVERVEAIRAALARAEGGAK